MARIHWKRLNNALIKYGEFVSGEMRDTLMDQGHIDTDELRKSIKPYTELEDNRKFLYVSFKDYGQFSDRWFRKGTTQRDVPTFIMDWYDNVDELNDIIEDSARDDIENNINEFIREFNNR